MAKTPVRRIEDLEAAVASNGKPLRVVYHRPGIGYTLADGQRLSEAQYQAMRKAYSVILVKYVTGWRHPAAE